MGRVTWMAAPPWQKVGRGDIGRGVCVHVTRGGQAALIAYCKSYCGGVCDAVATFCVQSRVRVALRQMGQMRRALTW